jgi:4-amino-4-deoxy-L-arabinose transferase-like glycosyltransferase
MRAAAPRLALGALLAYFVVLTARHLTVVPPIFEDEPWFGSVGLKLATDGVLGSDMFAGHYGMERRYYAIPPVAPMLLGGAFRLAGFGLLQLRLETAVLGAMTLLLTYVVGRRLFGPTVGVLAVAFLLLVRMDPELRFSPTGILFLDWSRIARYDMPVPVFGLLAILTYLAARDGAREGGRARVWLLYGLAGALAGLSSLSHLYGGFWMAAITVLAMWDRGGWRSIVALGVGCTLTWVPYAVYVLTDLHDWAGQTRDWGPRFDLGRPTFYLKNVLREPYRYAPGLGPIGPEWLLRPGLWIALVAIATSLLALARCARNDRDARALAVPAILIPTLFALLITHKYPNYKLTIFPPLALAVAWGVCTLWRAAGSDPGRRWWRPAMLLMAALVAGEGLVRAHALERLAATTSPYANFMARVRTHIPPGTRVLGLHNYWLGFEDTDYRSWWVPIAQMDPRSHTPPLSADSVIRILDPEVVLLEPRIRVYLENPFPPGDPRAGQIKAWLRDWSAVAVVDDATYGRMEIHRRRGRPQPRAYGLRHPAGAWQQRLP